MRLGILDVLAVLVPVLAVVALVPTGARTQARDADEPTLEDVRAVFQRPGLTVGMLLQAVVDPGLDDEPARAQVAAARLRVSGELDGGFRYDLQTNFAAAPSLLDARVGWSPSPGFAVDAGRFKTPFSREFLTYAGSIDFVDRSRVVTALAPNRQVGARLSGQLDEHVSWAAGGFTGGSGDVPGEPLVGVFRLQGAGIEATEDGTVGQDGAAGRGVGGNAFRGDGVLLGLDGRFTSGPLLLAAEYVRAEWEPSFGAEEDAGGL